MAIRGVAAVVGRPIGVGLKGRLSICVPFAAEDAPQQVNLSVRCTDLRVEPAFVENDPADGAAADHR